MFAVVGHAVNTFWSKRQLIMSNAEHHVSAGETLEVLSHSRETLSTTSMNDDDSVPAHVVVPESDFRKNDLDNR